MTIRRHTKYLKRSPYIHCARRKHEHVQGGKKITPGSLMSTVYCQLSKTLLLSKTVPEREMFKEVSSRGFSQWGVTMWLGRGTINWSQIINRKISRINGYIIRQLGRRRADDLLVVSVALLMDYILTCCFAGTEIMN